MLEDWRVQGGRGIKGGNWENYNSIINIIYLKEAKQYKFNQAKGGKKLVKIIPTKDNSFGVKIHKIYLKCLM